MGTLTVRENILFAANLKMADSSKEDKKKCVDEIVQSLGLERCENTRIGNELFQGVSGGERKRCCIGMELVTKPKIIFLGKNSLNDTTLNEWYKTSSVVARYLSNVFTKTYGV